VLNPLRSEQEAFRALVWVVAVVAAVVMLVLVARAIF
jgi:CHASE3 domain sensor protein